jgi:hypothetical protein
MKASHPFFAVFLIAAIVSAGQSKAAEVAVTYRFDKPQAVRRGDGFSQIVFESTVQAGKAGEPTFPFRGVQILLPPGEAVSSFRLERRRWTALSEKHRLYPRQHPIPSIEVDRGDGRLLMNEAAFEIDHWIHPPTSDFTTHYLCGHAIAVGSFTPVGYLPASGEVGYYKEVEVIVETFASAPAGDALRLLRTDAETGERVTMIVDNPSALADYASGGPALPSTDEVYEYLIITRADLVDDFMPLRNFYTRRGQRAKILTVEQIEISYICDDTAEKIRSAIIDEYATHGITHVLLGGDADGPPEDPKIVAYRGLYCGVQSSNYYEDENIPADLYFAALDGTWNDDGDDRWGEPGEEDLYSEVAVGRACIDTPEEAAVFINKTITYQDSPVPGEARTALMLGEHLYSNPLTYGGDELDQLIGTCTAHGFTTTGIPAGFGITKYYDRDLGSWSKTVVFSEVNSGVNWVSHAGHCNSGYCMRLLSSDITDINFTNDGTASGFPLIYTYGCYTGAFDNCMVGGSYVASDCIAEEMITIEHCAAALLANSRYGWFTEGTTNGPSHHFQREFFDAIFTEGYTNLGTANQRSKDETAPFVDLPGEYEPGAHRWCFYTMNLIGDPALDGWTDTPESLAVSHPASFDRSASSIPIEAGVEGAVAVLYHDGVCFGRGIAGATGSIDLGIYLFLPDSISAIELDVCAHNHYVYRDTLMIDGVAGPGTAVPPVSLEQNAPNPFNPSTVIRFSLREADLVDLRVFDVTGREVDRLLHEHLAEGPHTVTWRPDNLPSGVYFYVMRTNGIKLTRKAVLLR